MPLPKAPSKKGSLLTQLTSNATSNATPRMTPSTTPLSEQVPASTAVSTTASTTQAKPSQTHAATPAHAAQKPHQTTTHSAPPAAKAKPISTVSGATAPATQKVTPQNVPKHTPNHASKAVSSNATAQLAKQPTVSQKAPHSRTRRKSEQSNGKKLFVLDTNVMLHDPSCLFRFEEHDVYIPLIALEELDAHKKGTTETARNGRSVSRMLDQLMAASPNDLEQGIPLNTLNKISFTDQLGRLFFQTQLISSSDAELIKALPVGKADNQILGVVHAMQTQHKDRTVVLVSKDINMRIKARALGLNAEDYFNDQVIDDVDVLYDGQFALPVDFWEHHSKNLESWQEGAYTYYRVQGPLVSQWSMNEYLYYEHPDTTPLHGQVVEIDPTGRSAVIRTLIDYTNPKHGVWGIGARNREQNYALNVLMDTNIDFVTLLGQAGTGKTLLTIAAALQQTLEMGRFAEVIITRATVAVGEDIGFLPGTEEEKMTPWMGALQDNLEVLIKGDAHAGEWARAATGELIKNKVKIKAMSFMRGRTFVDKLLVIDEAQNLTPKQMKTLITRAGSGTKVVCMGNLSQIDTPYLTEASSGLAYVVEHFKNWPHSAHITLKRGERSRLADFANEVL